MMACLGAFNSNSISEDFKINAQNPVLSILQTRKASKQSFLKKCKDNKMLKGGEES